MFFLSQDRDSLGQALVLVRQLQADIAAIGKAVATHTSQLEAILSEQSHLDTDVAQIKSQTAAILTASQAAAAAIASLKVQHPTVDFTELDSALGDLGTASQAVQDLTAPPATP